MFRKCYLLIKYFLALVVIVAASFGAGRLYYAVTGGFTIGNIQAEIPYHPKWNTHPLSIREKEEIRKALDQTYSYLGKGCQAYVFASTDGKYVIKFFKYQRFRPQEWINLFTFIPAVKTFQLRKAKEKNEKLEKVFTSWKIAFENLKNETGVIYVHLNKSDEWHKSVEIRDKMGFAHQIDLDQTEFILQRRAIMLCPAFDELAAQGRNNEAEGVIDKLLTMLLLEYGSGFADNDHALMQNTGVLNGFPIHIDVGQFIRNEVVKVPKVYKHEIYDKTYNFHQWLKKHHPDLADHLEARLVVIMGPDYFYSAPYRHKGDVAKIPHEEPL